MDLAATGFAADVSAGLDAPSPAVPRYGTPVADGAGAGFNPLRLPAGAARPAPFACAGLTGASFFCIFDCALSTEPDALRFRGGGSDARFDGAGAR